VSVCDELALEGFWPCDRLSDNATCVFGDRVCHATRSTDLPPGMQIGKLLAGQKAAFGEVHAMFHFALVLGRARPVWADQEAIVLGLPPIRLAEHRVVQVRLEDGGFQVVQDDPPRDAAEPLKGVSVHASQVPIFWSKTSSAY
jgi:hypothetical protein